MKWNLCLVREFKILHFKTQPGSVAKHFSLDHLVGQGRIYLILVGGSPAQSARILYPFKPVPFSCLLVCSFVFSFARFPIRLFVQFVRSLVRTFVLSFIPLLFPSFFLYVIRSFYRSLLFLFVHLSIRLSSHPLIYPFIHLCTHPFVHSLIQSFVRPSVHVSVRHPFTCSFLLQVAYLEKLRGDKLYESCVVIQKTVRCWQVRKRYVTLRNAAIVLQAWARGHQARR